MQRAVQMRNIVKRFGATRVLDGLDLSVSSGEKVALIGSSGSGKSTVLRILMGLETADGGELSLLGHADLAQARRQVGMVFQQFNLFPHMSALRNVMLAPVHVLGLPVAAARARAMELLARVGMEHKAEASPAELSGGQQQRVAIARALAMEPRLLLLDEVTSALDPELVGEVTNVIRELATHHETTMILVTHQLEVAAEVADRVVFLDAGRVVEEGTPASLLLDPRAERTRAFVSRMGWARARAQPS